MSVLVCSKGLALFAILQSDLQAHPQRPMEETDIFYVTCQTETITHIRDETETDALH